jgi:hypothetical protein
VRASTSIGVVAALVTGLLVATAVSHAAADPAGTTTDRIGNIAAGGTASSTACPAGTFATGTVVLASTLQPGDPAVEAVELTCSDGSTTAVAGNDDEASGEFVSSGCDDGSYLVGVYGRTGDVVDALGSRCLDGPDSISAGPLVGGAGGSDIGPAECPGDTKLTALTVWTSNYSGEGLVRSIQGTCAVRDTTTTLSVSPNARYPFQNITITATVTPMTDIGPLTGNVDFFVPGGIGGDDVPIEDGVAVFITDAVVGPAEIEASYEGDDNYDGSLSAVTSRSANVTTARVGGAPDGTTVSSTFCLQETFTTGIGVETVKVQGARYVQRVRLSCSDGSDTSHVPDGPDPSRYPPFSDCGDDAHAVGLYARSGDYLDAVGARCVHGSGQPKDAGLVGDTGGGSASGPADCPAATKLIGVTVWSTEHDFASMPDTTVITGMQGVCADAAAPTVHLNPLPDATLSSSVALSWHGSDPQTGVSDYQLRYRSASGGGFGAWHSPYALQDLSGTDLTATGLTAGHEYCYQLRGRDQVGNVSAWTSARCTALPVDDRALQASAHWHRKTSGNWWNNTATVSSTHGASLQIKRELDRVGVVATRCSNCGSIAVYVGHKKIGSIDLHAGKTEYQSVLLLPHFGLRTGTVRIKVTSPDGKTVQIDGLISRRT